MRSAEQMVSDVVWAHTAYIFMAYFYLCKRNCDFQDFLLKFY